MILLDDRIGSKELLPLFRPFGVDVELSRLDSADMAFAGNGPKGDCMVGIERKRISDLCQSMRDRRLSGHQLPKLLADYEYVFLIVEGMWRPGRTGVLETYRGRGFSPVSGMMYAEVDSYLTGLSLRAGIEVKRSASPEETVAQTINLFRNFDKNWSAHTAHNQVYAPIPTPRKAAYRHRSLTPKQKLVRDFAAQIPGIDRKCESVMDKFPTVRRMFEASKLEWEQIDGIGDVLATRITTLLRDR